MTYPIKMFIGLLSISFVFKNLYLPILLLSFSPVQFLEPFPFPPLSPPPSSSPHPLSHKPYPQSKTFLNIQAVLSSAVFCSNAVIIQRPVLLYNSSVSLMCYQVPLLPVDDLFNASNVPYSFDFSL